MGDQYDNPNTLPSTRSQSKKGKRRLLGCGVGLLAVLSAAALLAAARHRGCKASRVRVRAMTESEWLRSDDPQRRRDRDLHRGARRDCVGKFE
jgi:hypothetical protein